MILYVCLASYVHCTLSQCTVHVDLLNSTVETWRQIHCFCSTTSVFHINICSLRDKISKITDVVDEFDILAFTETHLDASVNNVDILISNFTILNNVIETDIVAE